MFSRGPKFLLLLLFQFRVVSGFILQARNARQRMPVARGQAIRSGNRRQSQGLLLAARIPGQRGSRDATAPTAARRPRRSSPPLSICQSEGTTIFATRSHRYPRDYTRLLCARPRPSTRRPISGARSRRFPLWVLQQLNLEPLRPAAPRKFLASRGDKLNSARMQGVLAGQAQKWARKRATNAPTSRAKVRFRIENDVTRAII
jgi:hypothetical protein